MIKSDVLMALSAFKSIPASQVEQLGREAVHLDTLRAGADLFNPGDPDDGLLFALPEARSRIAPVFVRLELPTAHQVKPVRFERIVEGELFGETEWLSAGLAADYPQRPTKARRRGTRAQLMSNAEVFLIPNAALAVLLGESPLLRQRIVRQGALRLKNALTAEARRRHLDGDATLAEYLLDLAEDHHRIHGNYARFTHKVTQDEISADLGISRRALSERFRAWFDAGLVRTTPLEILDIRRVRQLEQLGKKAAHAHVAAAMDEIGLLLDGGDLIAARAMALDLLHHFPASPDLAFAAALASARAGRNADAHAVLSTSQLDLLDAKLLFRRVRFGLLRPTAPAPATPPDEQVLFDMAEAMIPEDEGAQGDVQPLDERPARRMTAELLALQGRLAKDAALVSGLPIDAERAAQLYDAAARAGAGAYARTNAALLSMLADAPERGTALARQAIEASAATTDYWGLASCLEAQLLLGDSAGAAATAGRAMATVHSDAMVATTRRQLRRFAQVFPTPATGVLERLAVKRPFVFSGVMIRNQFDADPAMVEAAARAAVETLLDTEPYGAAFGALAQGADILFAELALDRGIELNAVLPFNIEDFIEASVADHWVSRFNAVIAKCNSVTIAQPGAPSLRNLDIALQHGFRCAAAQTLERAGDLETTAVLLAINAGGPAGSVAGTTVSVNDWRTLGGAVREVTLPFTKRSTAGPDREAHGYRHVLFHFPDGVVSSPDMVKAVANGVVIARPLKDGRISAALQMESMTVAAEMAFRLRDDAPGGRIICSYGPLLNRAGQVDPDLLAALAGASDLPGFPRGSVLATLPFAREVQFARDSALAVFPLARRIEPPTGQGAQRIAATGGVYEVRRG